MYWLIIDGNRQGPLTLEEVLSHPAITPVTPVWHDGMDDWAEAQLLPELECLFVQQQQPFGQDSAPVPPVPPVEPQQPFQPVEQGGYYRRPANPGPQWWHDDDRRQHKMPPTYLALAIITTICCCIITGVVAIIYSSRVSAAFYRGDYEEAKRLSDNALIWVIVSFVLGLIMMPFTFLFQLLTVSAAL